jgi:hypothetical protein
MNCFAALSANTPLRSFGRQRRYLAADLVGRNAQVIGRLQIEPELRAGLEPVAEAKRGVAGDGALALDDLRDAVRWHGQLPRQFGGRDVQLIQFVGENFAGMDCGAGHRFLPLRNDNPTHGLPQTRRHCRT